MKTEGNVILITGGATGIGLALAEAFLGAGNRVLICGRRTETLSEAKKKLPDIVTRACDLTVKKERESLLNWVGDNYPDLNVLVNNAGVQKMVDFKKGTVELLAGEDEIETNFTAPIQMCALFTPLLMKQKEAAVFNVSSGLAFVPMAMMPVYCATKAGVHSFTMSLRHQLKDTSVKVFEIVPPRVNTGLGGVTAEERNVGYSGIPPAEVAEATLKAWKKDEFEILVGDAKRLEAGSRRNPAHLFQEMNRW